MKSKHVSISHNLGGIGEFVNIDHDPLRKVVDTWCISFSHLFTLHIQNAPWTCLLNVHVLPARSECRLYTSVLFGQAIICDYRLNNSSVSTPLKIIGDYPFRFLTLWNRFVSIQSWIQYTHSWYVNHKPSILMLVILYIADKHKAQ